MSTLTLEDAPELLSPGTKVEVRNGFTGTWSRGFEVDAAVDRGYAVRRLSDGMVLPATFSDDDVRRERRSMWWV